MIYFASAAIRIFSKKKRSSESESGNTPPEDEKAITEQEHWFKVLHFFLEKFNKGPEFLADLTLDQILIYMNEGKNPDDVEAVTEFMDPELFKAVLKANAKGK